MSKVLRKIGCTNDILAGLGWDSNALFMSPNNKEIPEPIVTYYNKIIDVSDVVTGEPNKTPKYVSLTNDPVYATFLESKFTNDDNPVLLVPIARDKVKKCLKNSTTIKSLNKEYSGVSYLKSYIIDTTSIDVTDDIMLVTLKNISCKMHSCEENRRTIDIIFIIMPDEYIHPESDEELASLIPEEFKNDNCIKSPEALLAAIIVVIAKKLGYRMVSLGLHTNSVYGIDILNTSVKRYIDGLVDVSQANVFNKYIKSLWINAKDESTYLYLCNRLNKKAE